ncbi:MAG: hypothetical protein RR357_04270 [Clostridia bacterium]
MKRTKEIAIIGIYSALLIGVQFVLSFAAGIELVSLMLAVFSVVYGAKRGIVTALIFSVLRIFIFGAIPSVMVLYVIYYPLYAFVCAQFGKINGRWHYLSLLICVAFMTVCFTLLDDLITPLMMSFSTSATKAYFLASLPILGIQAVCSTASVAVLYLPIKRLLEKIKSSSRLDGEVEL